MANKKEIALRIVGNITANNLNSNDNLMDKLEDLTDALTEDQTEELDTVWMMKQVLMLVDIDKLSKS